MNGAEASRPCQIIGHWLADDNVIALPQCIRWLAKGIFGESLYSDFDNLPGALGGMII